MSKPTPDKGKTTSGAKPATSSKAAKAGKGGYFVAAGENIRSNGVSFGEGKPITQADLAYEGNDGKAGFQRLIDSGKVTGEPLDPDAPPSTDGEPIGGAGPSAAQIAAAELGNDPGAKDVVDAALKGDAAAFTEAAEADSTPPTTAGQE
jgi:hypothetical protein